VCKVSEALFRLGFLSLLLLVAVAASAQTSRVGGTILGYVADVSGARIAGAEIQVQQAGTNVTRKVYANQEGIYRVADLRIGSYEIRCTAPTFAPFLHVGVVLELGATVTLDIVLRPASTIEQMTVSEQPPIIDTSQTSVAFNMDYEGVEETPLRTRNYLDFTLLAAGVSNSNQPHVSSSQTPMGDSGFTFAGLRARSNTLSIDGLDNNDEFAGASRTALSIEIVS